MTRIEIVAIGSEILKGLINNSNASEISNALLLAGYHTERHTVLADDLESLKSGLIEALDRNDIVISTGGLGPTCDDMTREIAAAIFDSDFYFDHEIANDLKNRYGSSVAISLENQATIPTKAIPLKNALGTAPGLIFHTSNKHLILLPGVPQEMRALLHEQVIPYLLSKFPHKHYISRLLHFFEVSESSIDPYLRELQKHHPKIEFGIYPHQGTVTVQLTAKLDDKQKDDSGIEKASDVLLKHFADKNFIAESGNLEEAIYHLFSQQKWTLSVAESCTGGAIAARLTKQPGASNYFLGGIVCYSTDLKKSLLHVQESTLLTYGAVSEQTVSAMALGSLNATKSDFAIAISGIAGPAGDNSETPVGTIWIAIAKQQREPLVWCIHLNGNRDIIIERSINAAMSGLLRYCAPFKEASRISYE